MRIIAPLSAALACGLALPALAEGPSFDCARAESSAEKLVCEDADLAALDRRLAGRFAAAEAVVKDQADAAEAMKYLKATQRGWIKGRDECWKAEDLRDCVEQEYLEREGALVARYLLEEPFSITSWSCGGNKANELVVYVFDTQLSSLRIEHGDTIETAFQTRSGSGAKYAGSVNASFWMKGEEAVLEDAYGARTDCKLETTLR